MTVSKRFSAALRDDLPNSRNFSSTSESLNESEIFSDVCIRQPWHVDLEKEDSSEVLDLDYFGYELEAKGAFLEEKAKPVEIKEKTVSKAESSTVDWLLNACIEHCASTSSGFSGDQLANSILEVVKSCEGETLQSRLFDLIGENGFSLLMEVMQRHDTLKGVSETMIQEAISKLNDTEQAPSTRPLPPPATAQGPRIVGAASIQTDSEIAAARKQRKLDRKAFKAAQKGEESEESPRWIVEAQQDPNYLQRIHEAALRQNAEQEISSSSALIKEFGMLKGGFVTDSGLKTALPKGTVRTQHKSYEKVFIPAAKKDPSNEEERIPISQLDSIGQKAFQGIERLNRLQTSLFQDAYYSSENLLVCAPTGAGKTNVAMLTIAREVSQRFIRWKDSGASADTLFTDFKIIYVAPMKALAQEVVAVRCYFLFFISHGVEIFSTASPT